MRRPEMLRRAKPGAIRLPRRLIPPYDITVQSQGPRVVRVTYVAKHRNPEIRAFTLRDVKDDILSIDSTTIEDTQSTTQTKRIPQIQKPR